MAFWLLGLIWGSSYLWIKIAVSEIGPFKVVGISYMFALIGLIPLVLGTGQRLPRDRNTILSYLFLAVFNGALPSLLISWAETQITSGLAAILNGTVPLFTLIVASTWFHNERITVPRMFGLFTGMVGVIVLTGRDAMAGFQGNVMAQIAILISAICYAVSINFSRKYLSNAPAIVQAASMVLLTDVLVWFATPAMERLYLPTATATWFSLAWLGLVNSGFGYVLYFHLIRSWGATRASLVNYFFPVIGLMVGIIFLREAVDSQLLVGAILIIAGIVVVTAGARSRSM